MRDGVSSRWPPGGRGCGEGSAEEGGGRAGWRRACCAFTRRVALSTQTMRAPVTCPTGRRRTPSRVGPDTTRREPIQKTLAGTESRRQRDAGPHLRVERAAVPRLLYSQNALNPRHDLCAVYKWRQRTRREQRQCVRRAQHRRRPPGARLVGRGVRRLVKVDDSVADVIKEGSLQRREAGRDGRVVPGADLRRRWVPGINLPRPRASRRALPAGSDRRGNVPCGARSVCRSS